MNNPIYTEMPSLLRHEGVWRGEYRYVNTQNILLDYHRSTIEVSFPKDGDFHYLQKNHFVWDDGREVSVEHPGVCKDHMLYWNSEHIKGRAWESGDNTIILTWQRHDTPGIQLTEIIILPESTTHRARTWHWFKNGVLFKRTLIDEYRC